MQKCSLTYDSATCSFYCRNWVERYEVSREDAGNPEELLNLKEPIPMDSAECAACAERKRSDERAARAIRRRAV